MAFVRGLVEAVEALGVARDDLLQGSSFDAEDLADPLSSPAPQAMDALVERAIALTGDPALGLRWWEHASFGAFGAVAHALSVSRSFGDGLALMERYWPLFLDRPLLAVHDEGALFRIVMNISSDSQLAHRAYMEAAAFALCRFLRQCVGIAGQPVLATFDYEAPSYRDLYDSLLRCPLRFSADESGLTVRREHMEHQQLNYAPALSAQLRSYADGLLSARSSLPLASQVLGVLRSTPDARRSAMEDVAARLGMSERTLRRRLSLEGSSFPLLAQQVLSESAVAMLKEPNRSVKEVAYALGFADTSAFHRAVRRWTGKSPSDLRELRRPASKVSIPPPPTLPQAEKPRSLPDR